MKTTNDLIKELRMISAEKRKLPIVIECPNGDIAEPNIKMVFTSETLFEKKIKPERMIITWR